MTLNLDQYQAPHPYPAVRRVRPDRKLAATLLEGYAGEYSELTTVLQYSYHSLRCRTRYDEIATVMRGISYVETIHLRLLGELTGMLGEDPQYLLAIREKRVWWQGSLVEYETTTPKMLLSDLEGEKRAAAFYDETALSCGQPEIAALLSRLAEDEHLHVRMLTDLHRKYFRR